jgi:hypothetical protein
MILDDEIIKQVFEKIAKSDNKGELKEIGKTKILSELREMSLEGFVSRVKARAEFSNKT